MNPLNHFPRVRRIAYYVQFVVAGLIFLTAVGYGAAGAALPQWYVVVAAVASALWSYLGLTAGGNVSSMAGRHPADDAALGFWHERDPNDVFDED